MPILPSEEAPFGALEPLHRHLLKGDSVSVSQAPAVILALTPLGIMAYLLQFPGTKPYRLAIAPIGILLLFKTLLSHRFTEPAHNGLNLMVGVGTLHLFGKYVEFALLHGPIEDKYIKRGRSRLLAAFDLPINSRWLGLRELDSKGASSRVSDGEANSHVEDVSEAVRPHANGRALKSTTPAQLPTTSPRRTRLEASVRHLNLFFIHFTMTAFLCILLREVGSDTIGNARGIPNSVNRFLSENTFVLLPFLSESSSLSKIPLFFPPSWIIEIIIEWFGFLVVWQTLVMGFRFVALLGVASGLYEVEAWETDLFNAPWKAESLIDMWGKRWHQLFRHHFTLFSNEFLRLLHIPPYRLLVLPLVFFLSGMMHALGQITFTNAPNSTPVVAFFFLSGVGCAMEVAFKRVTGRKVRGWAGRTWLWIWLFATGRPACRAWLDSGVAGTWPVPYSFGLDEVIGMALTRIFRTLVADVIPKGGHV